MCNNLVVLKIKIVVCIAGFVRNYDHNHDQNYVRNYKAVIITITAIVIMPLLQT